MKRQAILFDFWQTLFCDMKERETFSTRKQLVRDFLKTNNYNSEVDLDAAFEASRPWFLDVYTREQRTPGVVERLTWVLRYCNITLEPDEMRKVATEFEELGLMLDPMLTANIKSVLSDLTSDFRLGIVSDTGYTPGRVLRKHMQRHAILEYFSGFSFSDETGRAKPHPRQFTNVLYQLGVTPEQSIHCGDTPTHDIRGAKNLGIAAVLYTGCHSQEINGDEPDFIVQDWLELSNLVRTAFTR